MYAIVETGGKQYKLEEGRYVDIELLHNDVDEKVVFDKVVMLVNGKNQKLAHLMLKLQLLKAQLLNMIKLKKSLFSNNAPKKVTEKNKATDNNLQELWLIKLTQKLLKKLQVIQQMKQEKNNGT